MRSQGLCRKLFHLPQRYSAHPNEYRGHQKPKKRKVVVIRVLVALFLVISQSYKE